MKIPSAKVYHVEEIMNAHPGQFESSSSVRITGKLIKNNEETGIARIEWNNAYVDIDTRYIQIPLIMGHLYQFLGELEQTKDSTWIVHARIARNVNGLDMKLFQQAIQLQRQFLATTSAA